MPGPRQLGEIIMRNDIMYIELKGTSSWVGAGRIGRVKFSKTGRTIYYQARTLQPIKHPAGRANYADADTDEHYWISGCKKSGNDTLSPGVIDIDKDVREEYWLNIRNQPDNVKQATTRSEGNQGK